MPRERVKCPVCNARHNGDVWVPDKGYVRCPRKCKKGWLYKTTSHGKGSGKPPRK